jgi:hypothetical protein
MHFRSELISIEHFEIGVWLGLFSEIALLWRLKAEDRGTETGAQGSPQEFKSTLPSFPVHNSLNSLH